MRRGHPIRGVRRLAARRANRPRTGDFAYRRRHLAPAAAQVIHRPPPDRVPAGPAILPFRLHRVADQRAEDARPDAQTCRRRRAVLGQQQQVVAGVVVGHVRARTVVASHPLVPELRPRRVDDVPAGARRPHAPLGFFPVVEEAVVERADLLDHLPPDQDRAPRDPVHGPPLAGTARCRPRSGRCATRSSACRSARRPTGSPPARRGGRPSARRCRPPDRPPPASAR